MHVEDTLDPSHLTTRKVDSMSDLVAEMVLGACDEDENAAADAAALAVARRVAVEPARLPPPVAPAAALFEPPRRSPRIAFAVVLGLLAVAASAALAFVALR